MAVCATQSDAGTAPDVEELARLSSVLTGDDMVREDGAAIGTDVDLLPRLPAAGSAMMKKLAVVAVAAMTVVLPLSGCSNDDLARVHSRAGRRRRWWTS